MTVIGMGTKRTEKVERYLTMVLKRIPIDDRDVLDRKNIIVIVPERSQAYHIVSYFYQRSKDIADPIPVHIIVLASVPKKQDEIIYTLAHEIAHVFLDHTQHVASIKETQEKELSADRTVIDWGFEKELNACPYNYLYGEGLKSI